MTVLQQEKQIAKQIKAFLTIKSPVANAINFVRDKSCRCVVFGGALRDIVHPDPVTPVVRDVDIVVSRDDIKNLKNQWPQHIAGTNRFGGLRLQIERVPVDVWAVEGTWAFRKAIVIPDSYYYLTRTTFLNIDGIIADLSPQYREGMKIFAKDFLYAFSERILDITLEQNPYPLLVTIKSLRAVSRYNLGIGHALAQFLHGVLSRRQFKRLEKEQIRHYGRILFDASYLDRMHKRLHEFLLYEWPMSIALSPQQQLRWW